MRVFTNRYGQYYREAAFAFREEKGKYEKSREIASEMKADGMSVELIAKFTHLSPEEIEKLP